MTATIDHDIDTATKADLQQIETLVTKTRTLSDLIRIGSEGTEQARGWGDGKNNACALTAGWLAAKRADLL